MGLAFEKIVFFIYIQGMNNLIKKVFIVVAFCGASLCSFAADVKPYVEADALPNALNFYPAPPDTMSPQFMYDMSQYIWGKTMRKDSARAALAVAQAVETVEDMAKMFSEPFGMEISAKKTPAIMNLLERGIRTLKQVGPLHRMTFNMTIQLKLF